MPVQAYLLSVVASFQDAANRHAIDEVMAMFGDDAEFELEGLTRLVGKKEIRSIFEYDAGVNGEIRLINCTATSDTVSCQLVETNDRLRLAGLDKLLYPSCVLAFEKGLIRSWRAIPDPGPARAFDKFSGAVRLWIAEHYPSEYARMFTREGRFMRNRENGERVVQLARQDPEDRPGAASLPKTSLCHALPNPAVERPRFARRSPRTLNETADAVGFEPHVLSTHGD